MNTITFIMIATIVVYLLGMLAIGFIFSRTITTAPIFT